MRNSWLIICFLSFLAFSCGGGTEVVPVSLDSLRLHHVKGVLFEKSSLEYRTNEIEVHVIDSDSGRSVLCSGLEHGMQVVQNPGQNYDDLDATFIRTEGASSETVGRFRIAVVERDLRHCPDAIGEEGMKVLGETRDLTTADLAAGPLSLKSQKTGYVSLQGRSGNPDPLTKEDLQDIRLKYLFIKQLASGEISNPEVEVHLVDVWNNQEIACIGDDQGLEGVEEEGIEYDNLFLSFVPIADGNPGMRSQWLRAVVVERDLGRCPQPFDVWNDRVIATTDVLTGEDLQTGIRLGTAQNTASIEFGNIDFFRQSFSTIAPIGFSSLKLTAIRFFGEDNEFSEPEVEIHLQDSLTGETIACAGESEGLGSVDVRGQSYEGLEVPFKVIWDQEEEPSGLIRLLIVDRDAGSCPEPVRRDSNNILAETAVSFSDLTENPILFFDGSELRLSY